MFSSLISKETCDAYHFMLDGCVRTPSRTRYCGSRESRVNASITVTALQNPFRFSRNPDPYLERREAMRIPTLNRTLQYA